MPPATLSRLCPTSSTGSRRLRPSGTLFSSCCARGHRPWRCAPVTQSCFWRRWASCWTGFERIYSWRQWWPHPLPAGRRYWATLTLWRCVYVFNDLEDPVQVHVSFNHSQAFQLCSVAHGHSWRLCTSTTSSKLLWVYGRM